jgi:hypothetical protein
MNALARALDRWFGRGDFSVTVPPMDGAFRPNDQLDAAPIALELPAPDALAVTSRGLLVSSGPRLAKVEAPGDDALGFDAEITALAGLPDGGAAVALADGRIAFTDGRTLPAHPQMRCITALAPAADGALLVANGSASFAPAEWPRDLMALKPTGSVWRRDPATGAATQLAGALAYPQGLIDEGGSIVVAESWRNALTRISPGARARPQTVLDNLPAYPGRLARAPGGDVWLALFAPRSQLVEFVLKERAFRERMLREIEPDAWVAPSLRSGRSPLEPIQQGGVRQLGVLKPWSPSRSCGLIVRLDADYRAIASYHSRAHGRRHGVTSCLAWDGRVFFTAKGDDVVASFPAPGASA